MPTDRFTNLGLLGVALIWGANFSIVKEALQELTPLTLNALRFPLASLLLVGILWRRDLLQLPAREDLGRVLALGVVGNIIYGLLFIFGLSLTRAGNASLLLATVPVWTILLSYFLGHKRPSALVWLGVTGTLSGMVLVVVGGGGLGSGSGTLVGDLLMIASAIGWSVYTVGSRNLIQRYGPMRVTAWTLWVGTIGLVAAGLPRARARTSGGSLRSLGEPSSTRASSRLRSPTCSGTAAFSASAARAPRSTRTWCRWSRCWSRGSGWASARRCCKCSAPR